MFNEVASSFEQIAALTWWKLIGMHFLLQKLAFEPRRRGCKIYLSMKYKKMTLRMKILKPSGVLVSSVQFVE
jgi:hypothetical protein